MLEVALSLQKALALVAQNTHDGLRDAALSAADRARDHGLAGLKLERQKEALAAWTL
jgi:hypothetical protein